MKFYYFVIFTELVKVPERVGKVGQDDQSPPNLADLGAALATQY